MAPKRRATTTTTTTNPITDAQLKALNAQGVADVLAERGATRSRNGNDSLDSGTGERRQTLLTHEYTYIDFLKCQPLNFKGIALTWWNSHIKTITDKVAYAMIRKTLKKIMTDKYCPRGKIKKLEFEMMFPEESNMIEKYVGGLPDMIHRSVMASKPKTMQDAIEFATELMDKKISTLAERQAENTRKLDNNNQAQQKPPKKQGMAIAYATRPSERRSPVTTNNQRNLTCYECGNQGHYRSDCPELKNQNHGNQVGGTRARGMVHALGEGETNQDINNMENDINA
ncbi:reverse transcriptase domain-containing protein [Tanacetum coccineum]